MVIDMNEAKLATLDQVRAFLAGTIAVEFGASDRSDDRYGHIAEVLGRFGYRGLKKPDKGLILRYLERLPDAPHWHGRCFVFDQRESLGADLAPAQP